MHPGSACCRLLEVSDRQQQARDAVTALCMGQHGGSVLLLVGHASGAIKLWELKTQLGGDAAPEHPGSAAFFLPFACLESSAGCACLVRSSWHVHATNLPKSSHCRRSSLLSQAPCTLPSPSLWAACMPPPSPPPRCWTGELGRCTRSALVLPLPYCVWLTTFMHPAIQLFARISAWLQRRWHHLGADR